MFRVFKKVKLVKNMIFEKLDKINSKLEKLDKLNEEIEEIKNNLQEINPKYKNRRISKYWEKPPQHGNNWYSFPITRDYIIESITGQSKKPLTSWMIDNYLTDLPIKNLLVVCCGHGNKERGLAKANFFEHCDAYDISEGAISSAKKLAIEAGVDAKINYSVMDFNSPILKENEYDLILCNGALHHIENLEKCISTLYHSLKIGGWLWATEFIGPSRFRYSTEEVVLINKAKEMIPDELGGRNLFHPDQLKPKLDADPSEAIRSSEIEKVLQENFTDLQIRYYGGNILMRVLNEEFFQNFEPNNEEHITLVHKLIKFEKDILKSGQRSHHAYFIARKI